MDKEYEMYRQEIEKYRLGVPRSYDNPNYPYSNAYRLHPEAFIPGYRQPIDGIVPDNYPVELEPNQMYPSMELGCKYSCMDMDPDFSDFLNVKNNGYAELIRKKSCPNA